MSKAVSFVRGLVNEVEEKLDNLDLVVGEVVEVAANALAVVKQGLAEADKALAAYDTGEPSTVQEKFDWIVAKADEHFAKHGRDHYWRTLDLNNPVHANAVEDFYRRSQENGGQFPA